MCMKTGDHAGNRFEYLAKDKPLLHGFTLFMRPSNPVYSQP